MCGRFTKNYTWQQLHALYSLNTPKAIPNFQPDFNVCPTDPADTIVPNDGARELVGMRWGLIPYWWNKPLKELRLATFNARVETVTTKPFFREPFKRKRCLDGRTHPAASSLTTSLRVTAHRCSPSLRCGTSGKTGKQESASNRAL